MPAPLLHRFQRAGGYYVVDPETCFCFECDAITWEVLDFYPETTVNRILYLLRDKHPEAELREVIGELEWLRSSGSILQPPKHEEYQKLYTLEPGLDKMTLCWPPRGDAVLWGQAVLAALLGRSRGNTKLHVEFLGLEKVIKAPALAEAMGQLQIAMKAGGKELELSLRITGLSVKGLPKGQEAHLFDAVFEAPGEAWTKVVELVRHPPAALSAWGKLEGKLPEGATVELICRPAHADFGGIAKILREAGLSRIGIDTDAAFAGKPDLNPASMAESWVENVKYYAEQLAKQDYFRLEPVAGLFRRVHEGEPLRRADRSGVHEMAIDAMGKVFPGRDFLPMDDFQSGNVKEPNIEEEALRPFEDVGSLTTAVCQGCWAKHLCGGGSAAVHHALGGSIHTPYAPWCDAQRSQIEAAIAAFNRLSSEQVNFSRLYGGLGARKKTSLMKMARAVVEKPLLVRPLAEADAALLTQWENWNQSAYFLCHERGLLITNQYDREMDAVHPRGFEQELMVMNTKSEVLGLLRMRPESVPGLATAWLYFHDEEFYATPAIRRGFKAMLRELNKQDESMRLVRVPVGPGETALREFLEAAGFQAQGEQRDALYLHGSYHPVTWLGLKTAA